LKGSIYLLSSFFKPSNYRKVDEHHRIITPFDGPRSVYFESFNDGKIIVLSTLARYRGILSRD
jgi:hypothetical protein